MNIRQKSLTMMLIITLSNIGLASEKKSIEVTILNNNGKVTKTITVNGKKLTDAEITKMQTNGELDTILAEDVVNEEMEISIKAQRDNNTKNVVVNSMDLSQQEIEDIETSGKLQTFHFDKLDAGAKTLIFVNTDTDGNNSIEHVNKIISKTINIDDDYATLGFMANIKSDGWHVVSVVKDSGAEEAGLKEGDVIKFMSGIDLTKSNDSPFGQTMELIKKEQGDVVGLEINRNGESLTLMVEARKNNSADMLMNIVNSDKYDSMTWSDDIKDIDVPEHIGIVVIDSNNNGQFDFDFNSDDIKVMMPEALNNLNMFISHGSSTSKLLGKNNQLASLSKGLAKYFKTDSGALVLRAGKDNLFGLEDGDVIKNISGIEVNAPKDVIKQLLLSKDQKKIELNIIRHKKNKTLKYNK